MQSDDSDVPRVHSVLHLIIVLEFIALSLPNFSPWHCLSLPHSLHYIFSLTHFLSFPMPFNVFLIIAETEGKRYSNGLTGDFFPVKTNMKVHRERRRCPCAAIQSTVYSGNHSPEAEVVCPEVSLAIHKVISFFLYQRTH